jgi:hypothetical protein
MAGIDRLKPLYDRFTVELTKDLAMCHERLKAIDEVADVFIQRSLTDPFYTVMFSDGQKISFDPNTVDWDQLERTCLFWSEHCFRRLYVQAGKIGTPSSYEDFKKLMLSIKVNRMATKMILSSNYGAC